MVFTRGIKQVITELSRRGYGYGSGLISADGQRFIINIPKNASSYLLNWASNYGYTVAIAQDLEAKDQIQEMVVVLRDPVERWISGIAQYLNTYILNVEGPNGPIYGVENMTQFDRPLSAEEWIADYNQNTERMLFDIINRFDDHVWPQHELFENVLPDVKRKFFYLDETFDLKISQYLGFSLMENLDKNSGNSWANIKKIQSFFRTRLNIRPELQQRVKQAYDQDYKFIRDIFNESR
jgi:hypothetical protein